MVFGIEIGYTTGKPQVTISGLAEWPWTIALLHTNAVDEMEICENTKNTGIGTWFQALVRKPKWGDLGWLCGPGRVPCPARYQFPCSCSANALYLIISTFFGPGSSFLHHTIFNIITVWLPRCWLAKGLFLNVNHLEIINSHSFQCGDHGCFIAKVDNNHGGLAEYEGRTKMQDI